MPEKRAAGRRGARVATRAGAVAAGTAFLMLLSSPSALALYRDDGDDPGQGLSVFETLGLYVVAPIALFAVITGLVILGTGGRRQR
ncbi:hypothetical protein [Streptomyces sp. RFCAC02]|uniref:hypothetical protein n=1 Tax=Streptomyces sp. RFCAC02 TaxID=2499143 RepID=UPI00102048B9|nr:hypothetical protein [Streptomyces sp. RFCAC02]